MVRHQYVVGNYLDRRCLQDVEYLVALQNQDEQNQDVVLTFQVVHLLHQLVVVADEVLHYLLKMDYCQDVVDEELMRHLLKMDYCQDVEQRVLLLPHLYLLYLNLKFSLLQLALALIGAQRFLREQP
jgi:hypothetical protein